MYLFARRRKAGCRDTEKDGMHYVVGLEQECSFPSSRRVRVEGRRDWLCVPGKLFTTVARLARGIR